MEQRSQPRERVDSSLSDYLILDMTTFLDGSWKREHGRRLLVGPRGKIHRISVNEKGKNEICGWIPSEYENRGGEFIVGYLGFETPYDPPVISSQPEIGYKPLIYRPCVAGGHPTLQPIITPRNGIKKITPVNIEELGEIENWIPLTQKIPPRPDYSQMLGLRW